MRAPIDTIEHPEAPSEVKSEHYARIRALSPFMQSLVDPEILKKACEDVDK